MQLLMVIVLTLLVALQIRLWSGDNGIAELRDLKQDIERQHATNQQLAQRNQLLHADIDDLRNAQDAVEERARNELGLIKQDETFFRLVRLGPESISEIDRTAQADVRESLRTLD